MSATTSAMFIGGGAEKSVSDAEVEELLGIEPEVRFFVVDKIRVGGAFFKYLNFTSFNLEKHG